MSQKLFNEGYSKFDPKTLSSDSDRNPYPYPSDEYSAFHAGYDKAWKEYMDKRTEVIRKELFELTKKLNFGFAESVDIYWIDGESRYQADLTVEDS